MSTEIEDLQNVLDGVDFSFAQSSSAIYALANLFEAITSTGLFSVESPAAFNLSTLNDLESTTINEGIDLQLQLGDDYSTLPITNTTIDPVFPSLPYLLPGSAHYMDLPEELIDPGSIVSYFSSLLTLTKASLVTRIKYGDTIWPAETENDAFIQADEQLLLDLEEKKDQAADKWAKLGFTVPNGILFKAFDDLEKEYLTKKMELSKEISFKMVDLEASNIKTALKISLGLESKLMDTHLRHQGLILKTMGELQSARNEIYSLWTELYGLQSKDTSLYYSTLLDKLKIMVEINKEEVERYRGILEGRKAVIKSLLDKLTTLLRQYEIELDAYRTSIEGYGIYNNTQVAYTKAKNDVSIANAGMDAAKAELDQRVEISQEDMNSSIQEAITSCQGSISGAASAIYHFNKSTTVTRQTEISDSEYTQETRNFKES